MSSDFDADSASPHHMIALIRHAKSDWAAEVPDTDRPLSKRGRRQAPETGKWLSENFPALDLAIVSEAKRARETWDLINAEMRWPVDTEVADDAYTFDGYEILDIIADLDESIGHVAFVGHNPAIEDVIQLMTDKQARMPTSAVAIISIRGEWQTVGSGNGRVLSVGRPTDPAD